MAFGLLAWFLVVLVDAQDTVEMVQVQINVSGGAMPHSPGAPRGSRHKHHTQPATVHEVVDPAEEMQKPTAVVAENVRESIMRIQDWLPTGTHLTIDTAEATTTTTIAPVPSNCGFASVIAAPTEASGKLFKNWDGIDVTNAPESITTSPVAKGSAGPTWKGQLWDNVTEFYPAGSGKGGVCGIEFSWGSQKNLDYVGLNKKESLGKAETRMGANWPQLVYYNHYQGVYFYEARFDEPFRFNWGGMAGGDAFLGSTLSSSSSCCKWDDMPQWSASTCHSLKITTTHMIIGYGGQELFRVPFQQELQDPYTPLYFEYLPGSDNPALTNLRYITDCGAL